MKRFLLEGGSPTVQKNMTSQVLLNTYFLVEYMQYMLFTKYADYNIFFTLKFEIPEDTNDYCQLSKIFQKLKCQYRLWF